MAQKNSMATFPRRSERWTTLPCRSGRLKAGAGFGGLDKAKALLDIPADLEVLAILSFGYPARAVGRGKKQRKPLREVAHLERYGRPFE